MFRKAVGSMLASMAAADINKDFSSLIQGTEEFGGELFEPLWRQYQTEFADLSPVDLDENAMYTFFTNLDAVITHNKKADKTYTRGINKFSAMTFEQVSEHFHFAENQANAE